MPRGTRAVHGAEVEMSAHPHGGNDMVAVSAVVDWLQVTCWCERRIVAVTQRDVREGGRTYSCGAPGCRAPDGTPEVVALAQWNGMLNRVRPKGSRSRTVVKLITQEDRQILRRRRVISLYQQGKTAIQIGELTNTNRSTVYEDIRWAHQQELL